MLNFFTDVMTVAFQTDHKGRSLFFPWGIISKGYLIPDAEMERRVKTFYKYYYITGLVAMLLGLILFGWPGAISIGILAILWYAVQVKFYLRRCETSNISVFQHMQDIAGKYNLVALWSLFLVCIVFGLLGGILMLLENLLAGIVFILLFGGVAGLYGTLLWLRKGSNQ